MRAKLHVHLAAAVIAVAAILSSSPALAAPKAQALPPPTPVVNPLPTDARVQPVDLTNLTTPLKADSRVGTAWVGALCIQPAPVTFSDLDLQTSALRRIFAEEVSAAGFKPHVGANDLFADVNRTSVDLELRAAVNEVAASVCADALHVSGSVKLTVEWQLYSHLRRELLVRQTTSEEFKRSRGLFGKTSKRSIGEEAFAANVRALLNTPGYRQAVLATASATTQVAAAQRGPLTIKLGAKPTQISEAVGSVVSVFAGAGHGSGVLISPDGHILTNYHVVGDSTSVRVRWSDGLEALGDVLRSDKRRDVALIKVAPRSRMPLAINRTPPQVGASVFAVGTPLDPEMQNTVTRGILSATRIMDGFSFIQSDVAVNPGNSGGPLLDEKGMVIGLTVSGYRPEGAPTGLNFFVPIGDALDFLQIQPAT